MRDSKVPYEVKSRALAGLPERTRVADTGERFAHAAQSDAFSLAVSERAGAQGAPYGGRGG